MDPFRIVHISALHFGMDHQRAVWDSLVDYLLRDLGHFQPLGPAQNVARVQARSSRR